MYIFVDMNNPIANKFELQTEMCEYIEVNRIAWHTNTISLHRET